MGSFYQLPDCEQEALVDPARITMKEMRDVDRADHAALDKYKKARRQTNEDAELDELFTQYALALSFFERWQRRGVESMTEVTRALNSYGGAGQREQVCVPLYVLHVMLHSHLIARLFVRISSTGCGSKLKCAPSALAGQSKRRGGPQPPMLASAASSSSQHTCRRFCRWRECNERQVCYPPKQHLLRRNAQHHCCSARRSRRSAPRLCKLVLFAMLVAS